MHTKGPTSAKKGNSKNKKRRGDDTSLEKLDSGGGSIFDKSRSLDRATRVMSRQLHKQVLEAGVRDHQRMEVLEEVREVAVSAIECEAARAEVALMLRGLSEADNEKLRKSQAAAEARPKVDAEARVTAEERAVAVEEKLKAGEEKMVAVVKNTTTCAA
jgi:hypothetical protein